MSKQLFVPSAGLASAGTQISALSNGEAGFFQVGSTQAVADLDTLSVNTLLQIIAKRANGAFQSSAAFRLADVVIASSAAPSAGTVQSTDITPILPATQAVGDEYIVRIIETSKGNRTNPRKTFSVQNVNGVDFTVATLIDALVARIGSDATVHVTAVDGTTKLTLTGADPSVHFRVAVDGLLASAGISYAQNNVPASGKTAQVKALEAECESFADGVTNKVFFPVNRPDSMVTGDNYTIYTFEMDKKGHASDTANPVKYDDLTIYIAETTGAVGAELLQVFEETEEITDDDV